MYIHFTTRVSGDDDRCLCDLELFATLRRLLRQELLILAIQPGCKLSHVRLTTLRFYTLTLGLVILFMQIIHMYLAIKFYNKNVNWHVFLSKTFSILNQKVVLILPEYTTGKLSRNNWDYSFCIHPAIR